ncbi:tetratricopeptide repeat protein [Leptospira sp. WS58.C1]|uniref:tetratricopeptide repeat protein n=1 Tax=Leptospira TaxID=171 RepID=UPI0002BE30A5|nr:MULTISPECIES: tetratricopeptide repeat protein [unclassified Leptospira]EMJ99881.1 tetratricopeptide repeat protein [Leptospira sp. B5-022]MCR1794532.1 tetratricopeptide repeat protein [Leptospira sp. id769339]
MEKKTSRKIPAKRRIFTEILKENYTIALTLIDREMSETGKDPELLYNFAICCSRTGNHKKCVSIIEELLEEFPKFSERDNAFRMMIYSLIRTGDYKTALAKTDERLKLSLDDIILLSLKASALEKSGDTKAAIETHLRILRLRPEQKNSLNSVAYLLLEGKEPKPEELKLAMENIKRALQLDPENPAYLDSFGVLLSKLGKMEEARKAFEKAITKAPNEDIILEHLKKLTQTNRQAT